MGELLQWITADWMNFAVTVLALVVGYYILMMVLAITMAAVGVLLHKRERRDFDRRTRDAFTPGRRGGRP